MATRKGPTWRFKSGRKNVQWSNYCGELANHILSQTYKTSFSSCNHFLFSNIPTEKKGQNHFFFINLADFMLVFFVIVLFLVFFFFSFSIWNNRKRRNVANRSTMFNFSHQYRSLLLKLNKCVIYIYFFLRKNVLFIYFVLK